MERTVVEKLDILFESEKDFPRISQALRNFQLLESGAVGKIEGISNERERWHGAWSNELRRSGDWCPEVASGGEVEPRRQSQVIRWDVSVVEGMSQVSRHGGNLMLKLADRNWKRIPFKQIETTQL